MKNKKGFTLIELLAVIIILGVLMIIAIPSVTKYINDSRKSGYVSTAKNIVGGARNLVYSGKLDLTDKDITYYIDGDCIKTDNGLKSPYGDITKAYVAVVLDGDNYEYFWMSVDDTNTGVNAIKNIDELENEDIVGDIDPLTIEPNIGIDKRKTIVKIEGENCVKSDPKPATRKMNSKTGKVSDPCPSVTETIYWAINNNKLILSDTEVSGLEMGNISGNSVFEDNAPWNTSNRYNINEIEIIGTVVPVSTAKWFFGIGENATTFSADLSNLVMCHVTSMNSMFKDAGKRATTYSVDLGEWDTSNVTDMARIFERSGSNATTLSIFGLNSWDTSNVTNMSYAFYNFGEKTTNFSLDLSSFDTSNVTNLVYAFYNVGYNSTTFNLNLSTWDLSKITEMNDMFSEIGYNSTTFSLNLSNWNTSNITNMSNMFFGAGYSASTFNLNLSNWNTSNVTNMYYMFDQAGTLSTNYNVIIPKTNENGINNTNDKFYGKESGVFVSPPSGKQFTLAS